MRGRCEMQMGGWRGMGRCEVEMGGWRGRGDVKWNWGAVHEAPQLYSQL